MYDVAASASFARLSLQQKAQPFQYATNTNTNALAIIIVVFVLWFFSFFFCSFCSHLVDILLARLLWAKTARKKQNTHTHTVITGKVFLIFLFRLIAFVLFFFRSMAI